MLEGRQQYQEVLHPGLVEAGPQLHLLGRPGNHQAEQFDSSRLGCKVAMPEHFLSPQTTLDQDSYTRRLVRLGVEVKTGALGLAPVQPTQHLA